MPDPTSDWRPLIAALAHDDTRTVFAQLVLGQPASLGDTTRGVRRTERSLETLRRAGMLGPDDTIAESAFRETLAAFAPPKAVGTAKFLTHGRITQYPSNPDERELLLRHVAETVLQPGEVIDERGMNERLAEFHDDVAALRRYLVDHELVERTNSGSQYALVT